MNELIACSEMYIGDIKRNCFEILHCTIPHCLKTKVVIYMQANTGSVVQAKRLFTLTLLSENFHVLYDMHMGLESLESALKSIFFNTKITSITCWQPEYTIPGVGPEILQGGRQWMKYYRS